MDFVQPGVDRRIELDIPPVDESTKTNLDYGVDKHLSLYCGKQSIPKYTRGEWLHFWAPAYRQQYSFALTFYWNPSPESNPYILVARRDEEQYLQEKGFEKAKAIGLPITYYYEKYANQVDRIPNSIIVFPAHSLSWNTRDWREDDYVNEILTLRKDFDHVCVCVHGDCLEKGYWADSFKKNGVHIVKGASLRDSNSLDRIAYLLSKFECMTTNAFGSVLAYAGLFGTRVSLYGAFPIHKKEDYKNDPVFGKSDQLFYEAQDAISEDTVRKHYPFLFVHPTCAVPLVEWGQHETGYDNVLAPEQLSVVFGWEWSSQVGFWMKNMIKQTLPDPWIRRGQILKNRFAKWR